MTTLLAALLATTAPTPSLTCSTASSLVGIHGMEAAVVKMGPGGLEAVADYVSEEPDCVYTALGFGASGLKETTILLEAASDALAQHPDIVLTAISRGDIAAAQVCRFGGRDKSADRSPAAMRRVLQEHRKAIAAVATAELQPARQQCLQSLDAELAKVAEKPKPKAKK